MLAYGRLEEGPRIRKTGRTFFRPCASASPVLPVQQCQIGAGGGLCDWALRTGTDDEDGQVVRAGGFCCSHGCSYGIGDALESRWIWC
jgi:hypothetical protein